MFHPRRRSSVRKYLLTVLLVLAVGAFALVAAGCGGDDDEGGGGGGNVTALPASSCGDQQYGGEGDPDYLVASDLPLQGGSRTQTIQMNKAMAYVLEQQDWKAGDKKIAFQACDDATAQLAKWDPSKCSANANAYKGNESLIGVDRDVQLGVRRDRDPGPEPGSRRRDRDDLARQHVRLPDGAVRRQRAREVLPERQAQLRPRRSERPEPGCGHGEVHAVEGREERLHPERQGGVRPRRREEPPGCGEGARHGDQGLRGLRPEAAELPGHDDEDQGHRS